MPTKNAKPSVSVISLLLCGRLLQPTPPLYWRSRRELPTGLSAANQPREAHVHPRRSRRRVSLALSRAGRSTMAYRTGQPRRKGTGGILLYPERKRKVYPEPRRGVYPERSEGPILVQVDATSCAPLCFQQLPAIKFCNSPVLITIQIAGRGCTPPSAVVKVLLQLIANCSGSPGSSPASTKPGDSKSPLQRLARIGRVGADDADAMIGERRVHAGKLHRRHVAGDAILRGDRASFARVVLRDRRIW